MNKKGFVFVESIVVLVVVALSLAMLLSSYSLVQRKTKEKEFYDKSSDKYLLYAISDLGTSDTCSYSIRCKNGDTYEDTINFRADVDYYNKNGHENEFYCKKTKLGRILYSCEDVLRSMQVRSIYVVKDVSSALRSSSATSIYDNGVIEYMKTLKKCNDENTTGTAKRNNSCAYPIAYMIGVFDRGNNDLYYASINLSGNVNSEARPQVDPVETIDLADNTFNVTYFTNGGTACDPANKVVTYDEEYGNLCETTRTGHDFQGWYLEPEYVYRVDSTTIVKTASNHTLYAKWEPKEYYITYNSKDGSECVPNSKLVKYYKKYDTLCTTTRTGYQFGGWYTEDAYTNVVTSDTTVTTASDHTLYAKWNGNSYTISYGNMSGANYGTNHPESANYDVAFTVNNPSKTGHTFTGWNITGMDNDTHTYGSNTTNNSSISGTKETSFKNLRSTAGTVTFTAGWSINTYTITYAGMDGATYGTNHPTSATYNTAFTVNNPSKSGYRFDGWNITGLENGITHTYGSSTNSGTSISGTKETSFKNLRATSGTVTFTATWSTSGGCKLAATTGQCDAAYCFDANYWPGGSQSDYWAYTDDTGACYCCLH